MRLVHLLLLAIHFLAVVLAMFPSELVVWGGGGGGGCWGYLLPPCSGLSSYGWHRRNLTKEKPTNWQQGRTTGGVYDAAVKQVKEATVLLIQQRCSGGLVQLLHCLSHTILDFMLIDQYAYQASTQHGLIVDPWVDLGKHAGAVATCAAEQLCLAARMEADVGGYVVDLAGKDGPGVLALAAGHLAKL